MNAALRTLVRALPDDLIGQIAAGEIVEVDRTFKGHAGEYG